MIGGDVPDDQITLLASVGWRHRVTHPRQQFRRRFPGEILGQIVVEALATIADSELAKSIALVDYLLDEVENAGLADPAVRPVRPSWRWWLGMRYRADITAGSLPETPTLREEERSHFVLDRRQGLGAVALVPAGELPVPEQPGHVVIDAPDYTLPVCGI